MVVKPSLLLLAAVVVAGIYIMPNVIATFYGTHTWEVNTSTGTQGLQCGICHQYIVNEMQGAMAGDVLNAHLNASNGTLKDTYMGTTLGLSKNATNVNDMCIMCHATSTSITGAHTQVIVRPCTDTDCHGNATQEGPSFLREEVRKVGTRLANQSADVHSSWFINLTGTAPNSYKDANDERLKTDYYACLGCHTHVGVDFNITRWQKYKLTIDKTGAYSVDVAINTTSTNQTQAFGNAGTKW